MQGIGWTCPDYFELEGETFFVLSTHQKTDNGSYRKKAVWYRGELNCREGTFMEKQRGDLDAGNQFYATQTVQEPDGSVVMIAWFSRVDDEILPESWGWRGILTLPRRLRLDNGVLSQEPVTSGRELTSQSNILLSKDKRFEFLKGRSLAIWIEFAPDPGSTLSIQVLRHKDEYTLIKYEESSRKVTLDTRKSGGQSANSSQKSLNNYAEAISGQPVTGLRIFLDLYSVEIFINSNQVLSSQVLTHSKSEGIFFQAEGTVMITQLKASKPNPIHGESNGHFIS